MTETVYVVVQDTSGAHEPEGAFSVWTTEAAALEEALRLNTASRGYVYPYGHKSNYAQDKDAWPIAPAAVGHATGSGAFYVVPVLVNTPSDQNIG
jgi:hypothetical protein